MEQQTQKQRMGDLASQIALFKRTLPHTHDTDLHGRCLKCDINTVLAQFEQLRDYHFPA
jgi:hypothetical protein